MQVGFGKGDVKKFCFKENKQILTKKNVKKQRRKKNPPKKYFPKRGWWTRNKENMEFWKGGQQKEDKEKNE